MLNPALDVDALSARYRIDQRILIENIFRPDIAERILAICSDKVPFDFAYFLDGRTGTTSASDMAASDAGVKARLSEALMRDARRGIGFLYCRYRPPRPVETGDADLGFLLEVTDFLNSPQMLRFVRRIAGRDDIVRADAQYTRYSAGQYLTRHRDVVEGESRRIAYVFGFTKNWHPDWGGLLQFYEDDGTPRDAWAPAFNCLTLFDVRHVHAVTCVTPFAGGNRYSLTGWFHSAQSRNVVTELK